MEIPIKGNSMQPILKEGDLVVVQPSKFYFFGDLVLFFDCYGKILCHRLLGISIEEGKFLFHLKGDASPKKDSPILKSKIIGKIVEIKREGCVIKVKRIKNLYYWIRNLCQWIRQK